MFFQIIVGLWKKTDLTMSTVLPKNSENVLIRFAGLLLKRETKKWGVFQKDERTRQTKVMFFESINPADVKLSYEDLVGRNWKGSFGDLSFQKHSNDILTISKALIETTYSRVSQAWNKFECIAKNSSRKLFHN